MKHLVFLLAAVVVLASCNNSEQKSESLIKSEASYTQELENDDYEGDPENKSYALGKVTFTADGKTYTINKFGLDPYTAITWFTPESGVNPMAGAVFKSDDYENNTLITLRNDIDTMQEQISGKFTFDTSGKVIASFVAGDENYMFSEGTVQVKEFSRKTGFVKLDIKGKCNYTVMFNPSAMKQNVDAVLTIDAFLPHASIDGIARKTEAAKKINIQ